MKTTPRPTRKLSKPQTAVLCALASLGGMACDATAPDGSLSADGVPSFNVTVNVDGNDTYTVNGSATGTSGSGSGSTETVPEPLELDSCDEPDYAELSWESSSTEHFTFYYLPGSAAEQDLEIIAASRESAYASIRTSLGLVPAPHIKVHFSPSRLAAMAKGRGFGVAYPGWDEYDVIYTGHPDGYESTHYGRMVALTLSYYVTNSDTHAPFVSQGLGEILDQSGRDYHAAYAARLNASAETRVYVSQLEKNDAWGYNRGRAGSFLSHVSELFGMSGVAELLRSTQTPWSSGCYRHSSVGCVYDATTLQSLLDYGLSASVDSTWEQVRLSWEAKVEAAMQEHPEQLPAADRQEIQNLLAVMDKALAEDDAAAYRTTMEGFYCEWKGEDGRMEIAERAVANYGNARTKLIAVYTDEVKNFPTAVAVATRTDERGVTSEHTIYLERFPVGWRVTWSPDWY